MYYIFLFIYLYCLFFTIPKQSVRIFFLFIYNMELTLISYFPNDSIKTWSSLSRVWCDREKRRQIPRESRDVCGTNRSIRSVVDALIKRRFFSRTAGYLCELSDSTMVGCEDTAVTKRANFSPPICSIYLTFPVVSCQRPLVPSFVALSHFAAEIRLIALVDFSTRGYNNARQRVSRRK